MNRVLMIGRFQPFHKGHLKVIKEVLAHADHLIIGIGSSQYGHTPENPFTAEERELMITRSLKAEGVHNFIIVPVPDIHNYPVWVSHVESLVPSFDAVCTKSELTKRLFEEAGRKVIEPYLYDRERYSGTEIRERMISDEEWKELVPEGTASVILEIDGVSRLREITEEVKKNE